MYNNAINIVITNTFEDLSNKYRGKNDIDMEEFCDLIEKIFFKVFFYVNRPFIKIKFNYNNHAIRLLLIYDQQKGYLMPIFITDKNDKKYGENMIRGNIENLVETLFPKHTQDLINGNIKWY